MTPREQLEKWANGKSIHNDERDECCPDFSCCEKINTSQDVKERFVKAFDEEDDEVMNEMLIMFLGEMLSKNKSTETVHVIEDKFNHIPVQ